MKNFTLTIILFFCSIVCHAGYVTYTNTTQSISVYSGELATATINVHGWGAPQEQMIAWVENCIIDESYQYTPKSTYINAGQTANVTFAFRKYVDHITTFTYVFATNNIEDCENNPITITVTYLPPICNRPILSGLYSTDITRTSAKLNFDCSDPGHITILYKKAGTIPWTDVLSTHGCFNILNGLEPNTTYLWKGYRYCTNGKITDYSTTETFTTLPCTNAPSNLNATPWSYGYTISFTPTLGIGSYFLEWFDLTNSTAGGTTNIQHSSSPNQNNFFYYVPTGHDFKFRLIPISMSECPSEWKTIYAPPCSLASPTNMALTSLCGYGTGGSCGYGKFTWSAVSGANRYEVEYLMYNLNAQTVSGTFQTTSTTQNQTGMYNSSSGQWFVKWRIRSRCTTNNSWGSWSDYTTPTPW